MAKVVAYHRPASLDQALALLDAPGVPKVLLAGGTTVNAEAGSDPIEAVDLQALGLSGITESADGLRIGATTTIQELADDEQVPATLADLARRELPSSLRTLGTVGGLIATGDPESELLAGLLVHEAVVTIVGASGEANRVLADVLADVLAAGSIPGIITAVSIETRGTTVAARTGRTPADRPIVAAVARRVGGLPPLLALCGVAATPIVVDEITALDPPDDFRGSSEYRRHLAEVLSARVTADVSR